MYLVLIKKPQTTCIVLVFWRQAGEDESMMSVPEEWGASKMRRKDKWHVQSRGCVLKANSCLNFHQERLAPYSDGCSYKTLFFLRMNIENSPLSSWTHMYLCLLMPEYLYICVCKWIPKIIPNRPLNKINNNANIMIRLAWSYQKMSWGFCDHYKPLFLIKWHFMIGLYIYIYR